ncbi:MAG: hypothetical protein ABL967_19240 [Bryobacteraceae bacterium]
MHHGAETMAHYYHVAVRRWVFWTSIGGVLFGASVLANLAFVDHSEPGDLPLALVSGAVFWALISTICWATDSIEVSQRPQQVRYAAPAPHHEEWEERAHQEALRVMAEEEFADPHPALIRRRRSV